jgi:hypothetical protein
LTLCGTFRTNAAPCGMTKTGWSPLFWGTGVPGILVVENRQLIRKLLSEYSKRQSLRISRAPVVEDSPAQFTPAEFEWIVSGLHTPASSGRILREEIP